MNIKMHTIFSKSLFIPLLFFSIGCSPSFYLHTQSDNHYEFKNNQSIVIYANSKSVEEKNFKYLLQKEFAAIGFQVIDGTDDAQLQTFFKISEDNGSYTSNLYLPKSTVTTGTVGGINYSEYSSTTQVVPYKENYSFKKVHIQIFSKTDNSVVWDCFFSIESDHFNEQVYNCVKNAISKFGTNFDGKITLP